jgi:hypothetical protein
MTAKSGDRIHMLGKIKRANPNERAGVIEDVLSDDPPRYVIRWDSGRSTVMAPLPGAIRIEPVKGKASTSNGKARASAAKPAAKSSAAKTSTAKTSAAKTSAAKAKPAARTSTRKAKSA